MSGGAPRIGKRGSQCSRCPTGSGSSSRPAGPGWPPVPGNPRTRDSRDQAGDHVTYNGGPFCSARFAFIATESSPDPGANLSGFDQMFAVKVRAPFLLTAAYAPQMAGKGGGAIVNVPTVVAARGLAGMAAHELSKLPSNSSPDLVGRVWLPVSMTSRSPS